MFRKFVALPLVCAVLFGLGLALLPAQRVAAQQGISWTTGFRVQNLGTATANVVVQLYEANGNSAGTINDTINAPMARPTSRCPTSTLASRVRQ